MHQSWDNGGIRENTQIEEKTGICLIGLYENISFFQTHEKEVGLASGYLILNCLMLTLLMHIQNHIKHRIFKVGMICSMFIHCFVFYIDVTKAAFT